MPTHGVSRQGSRDQGHDDPTDSGVGATFFLLSTQSGVRNQGTGWWFSLATEQPSPLRVVVGRLGALPGLKTASHSGWGAGCLVFTPKG